MEPVGDQVPCLAWAITTGLASTCSGSQGASVAPATTPTMRLTASRRGSVSSDTMWVRSSNQLAIIISFFRLRSKHPGTNKQEWRNRKEACVPFLEYTIEKRENERR